jgi:threonine dehydrogenase-like Zn-dependent dehydrogenase
VTRDRKLATLLAISNGAYDDLQAECSCTESVPLYEEGMRALVFDGTSARVREHAIPRADENTAIVRMRCAGVCSTDLEILNGYMGFRGVLGHELLGTVVDGPRPWRDTRVVAEINFACGHCANCERGLQRHCPNRRVMGILGADGAFAELVAVPLVNLHAVPEGVADEVAVFVEPLAAAFEILDQVEIAPGASCIVLGDGKLGLLVAQVLANAGAHVLTVGKHEEKLRILRHRGIETVRLEEWQPRAADIVVEATGTAAGLARAMAATRPRGTMVLKSTVAVGADLNLAPLVINEITVVGSRCGRFAPALAALASKSIDVRSLISMRVPLARADEAVRLAAQPNTLKVLIENE